MLSAATVGQSLDPLFTIRSVPLLSVVPAAVIVLQVPTKLLTLTSSR